MEENPILSALKDDEKLLWSGRPGHFETLDAVYKPKLIKDAIISLAVMIALLAGYVLAVSKKGAGIMPAIVIIIVVCCVLAPLSVFTNANKLKKNACYALTDKRLITAGESTKSVEYALIKDAKTRTDAAGVTSFVCGKSAIKASDGKLRGIALSGSHVNEEKKECDSLVFYAIEDADKLKNVLKPYIDIE